MTTAKKIFFNFILQGDMTKGEYGKGYYDKLIESLLSLRKDSITIKTKLTLDDWMNKKKTRKTLLKLI